VINMRVLLQPYKNLTVSSASSFTQPIGKKCDPHLMMKAMAQGKPGHSLQQQAEVIKLLIRRKTRPMPDFAYVANTLAGLKSEGDFDTKFFFRLARNNDGNFLLDVPVNPMNERVVEKFLEWLDHELEKP